MQDIERCTTYAREVVEGRYYCRFYQAGGGPPSVDRLVRKRFFPLRRIVRTGKRV